MIDSIIKILNVIPPQVWTILAVGIVGCLILAIYKIKQVDVNKTPEGTKVEVTTRSELDAPVNTEATTDIHPVVKSLTTKLEELDS